MITTFHNDRLFSSIGNMGSSMCVPQWYEIAQVVLHNGQAEMKPMGKWPWHCTTSGLENSKELRAEMSTFFQIYAFCKVSNQPVSPAQVFPRPKSTRIHLQPKGLSGKNGIGPKEPKGKILLFLKCRSKPVHDIKFEDMIFPKCHSLVYYSKYTITPPEIAHHYPRSPPHLLWFISFVFTLPKLFQIFFSLNFFLYQLPCTVLFHGHGLTTFWPENRCITI